MIINPTFLRKKRCGGHLKYNNKISYVDGKCMRSRKEAKYYLDCKVRKAKGEIKDFQFQVRFSIPPLPKCKEKGIRPGAYVLDFIITHNDGIIEYVDVKGYKTDVYKLKKKLMKFFYNIDIVEV